jgi:hypothetical protein
MPEKKLRRKASSTFAILFIFVSVLAVSCGKTDAEYQATDIARTKTADYSTEEFLETFTPTVTTTETPTVSLTAFISPTITPSETPWLSESFDEPLNLNIWDPNYYCYPQKWEKHHGYISMQLPTMESDQKDYQECLFILKIPDVKISRVRAVVQIISGYSEASYVGILSSCGEEFKERLGFGIGSAIFHPQSETSTPFYEEPVSTPTLKRILELSWDTSNLVLTASLYDFDTEELLSATQISCSEYPVFVKFGVYTIQGLSIQAIINQIEVWN